MSTRQPTFLLYGANGYTGSLIAQAAVEGGLKPVLAGRSQAVARLAAQLNLEHRLFDLEDPGAIEAALQEVHVVLHCAGPFSRTSRPMIDGCLRAGTHYLDITGEIAVFEAAMARDGEAKRAGILLMPGVGFDVVPSDCLAAHLASRLPGASHLALAFQVSGGVSRGTALTMVENPYDGGMVRLDGKLVPVPAAWRTRRFDFGNGPVEATTIPWGDVATAYWSTGIPNIEVYLALRPLGRLALGAGRFLGGLLQAEPVRNLQKQLIAGRLTGPDASRRSAGSSQFCAEVTDGKGGFFAARLALPEGYTLTVLTALLITRKVLANQYQPGYRTPSQAYGADLILEVAGVTRQDGSRAL